MQIIEGLYYSKDHEWVKVEGDKAYVGISDFAQDALGDIVFVELPEIGTNLIQGEALGSIESVKAASDVYCPVSGKVIKVNEILVDDPALLNEDPYENWMICVELTEKDQLDQLMNSAEYEDFCNEEA
ncbi:glycine cleavage system protein GcvH [Lutispora thermophila]|uniref:Glycine cleavage system H protein n=1 Tax=Lutispora thermophila DSM 19022 TaxID=1122184 RepID=A0A1M6GXJ4_9FIRM|nr:glycine cleavage system protein GcvH [Lutispora thermophila]SHJ14652.1 glycine cleavage system H protein [Lutispora thermophila DSM 19022]